MSAPDLLLRLGWAAAIIAIGVALYWLANHAVLYRAQRKGIADPAHLPFEPRGLPAILYFTTPECAPCRTIQRPALRQVQEHLGGRLQVVEVDAQERPDLASRWGVLSVPTTFIIDSRGRLRHVNHGVTRTEKLIQQLKPIIDPE